jgi:hypothetical protein
MSRDRRSGICGDVWGQHIPVAFGNSFEDGKQEQQQQKRQDAYADGFLATAPHPAFCYLFAVTC